MMTLRLDRVSDIDAGFQSAIGNRQSAMHRGFTMVEILTVIGIIAVLLGLIAVGFNVIGGSQERRTRVALEAAMGMLTEYENATPLTGAYKTCAINATGNEPDPMFESSAAIMNRLVKVPANKSAMEKVDASNIASVTVTLDPSSTFNGTTTAVTLTEAVLTDGWQKPLVYVGSGGLTNLKTEVSGSSQNRAPVTAPNGRPFWVSAGPDGIFETHDDNVYSFEN